MISKIKEIYNYREMIVSLIKRELRGKYKASVLGFLWTFLNPLFQMIVYTIVFSYILRSGIEHFSIFLFVGLIPWNFFGISVASGSACVVNQENLIKKIYFPRLVLPISYVTSMFINMLLTFIVIFVALFITRYGINPVALLFLPLVMIDRISKLDTVFYGIYNLGSCTRLTNLFHGILKCLTVLCLKDGLCGCTDQFYSVLF